MLFFFQLNFYLKQGPIFTHKNISGKNVVPEYFLFWISKNPYPQSRIFLFVIIIVYKDMTLLAETVCFRLTSTLYSTNFSKFTGFEQSITFICLLLLWRMKGLACNPRVPKGAIFLFVFRRHVEHLVS